MQPSSFLKNSWSCAIWRAQRYTPAITGMFSIPPSQFAEKLLRLRDFGWRSASALR